MRTFRRRLRTLGARCLALLLGTMPVCGAAQPVVSEASQVVTSRPMPADEYEKVLSEALKSATVEMGPKLKNPAISDDGLPTDVATTLQEQRTYLEKHRSIAQRAEILLNATRMASENTRDPMPPRHVACHKPMIRSVNGRLQGVVFTSIAADNTYSIEGCFFGTTPGIVQLEAQKASASVLPIVMQVDPSSVAWSDNELLVQLDTSLSGIPDQPVTLVIYPLKRPRIELRGCRFIAERGDSELLTVIPSSWVRLYPSGVDSRSIRQLEYTSPTQSMVNIGQNALPSSALVTRWNREQFRIGKDHYDFSRLNPGWVFEAVQLQTYKVVCPGDSRGAQSLGRWVTEWTLNGLSVTFGNSVCTSSVPPSFVFSMSFSQYAIGVWVVGPKGTQPLPLVQ